MTFTPGTPVKEDNVLAAIQWLLDVLEPNPNVGDEWDVLQQIQDVVDDMYERL